MNGVPLTTSQQYPIKDARVIAPLAARTQSGSSLERSFYCDDVVRTAAMEQVIGRKWRVAGHARD
jgi:hypothetical protein